MSKYNELVDTLLEAAAPPAVPPTTGAPPVPPTGTPPVPPTGTPSATDPETAARLKTYRDLYVLFNDPAFRAIMDDTTMDDGTRVKKIKEYIRTFCLADPTRSTLDRNLEDMIKKQSSNPSKQGQFGFKSAYNVAKKTFLPTHSGSTGVFA